MNILAPLLVALSSLSMSWAEEPEILSSQAAEIFLANAAAPPTPVPPPIPQPKGKIGRTMTEEERRVTEGQQSLRKLQLWEQVLYAHLNNCGGHSGNTFYCLKKNGEKGSFTISSRNLSAYASLQEDLRWLPAPDDQNRVQLPFDETNFNEVRERFTEALIETRAKVPAPPKTPLPLMPTYMTLVSIQNKLLHSKLLISNGYSNKENDLIEAYRWNF